MGYSKLTVYSQINIVAKLSGHTGAIRLLMEVQACNTIQDIARIRAI